MHLWYFQLQLHFYDHGCCYTAAGGWPSTPFCQDPVHIQGHFRLPRFSSTHYVLALMKKSCDWLPPSRCLPVTKLQSDLPQTPVGLVSSDPEMFTYSLAWRWKKKKRKKRNDNFVLKCQNKSCYLTARVSISCHFNFCSSDCLTCFVGQLHFVFGREHLVTSAWWMETPGVYMCRRITPQQRQVQLLDSWREVDYFIVTVHSASGHSSSIVGANTKCRKIQSTCLQDQ